MALAVLAFQAGGVSSAANVIVYNPGTIVSPWIWYPPGGYATLTVNPTNDPSFGNLDNPPNLPKYAGVFYGKVGGADAAFFCAELNHAVVYYDPLHPDVYDPLLHPNGTTFPLSVNVLEEAPLHDGNPVGSPTPAPTPLSERQLCLLEGVYAYLKVYNPDGYTTNTGTQDLTGTSTSGVGGIATMAGLTDLKAVAAQLVMWEIIHEADTGTTPFLLSDPLMQNAVSLTKGKLRWQDFSDGAGTPFPDQSAVVTEFNNIANYAYNTYTCVPEVTSPVALIAGGLVFVRRREPRALRLTKAAG